MLPPSSLIIPSRNRRGLLVETVRSVLQGRSVPSEIIVVDQSDLPDESLVSSADEQRCAVRYLASRSVGLSRARNEGIRAARHEMLAFLDDDMFVASEWYEALISALTAGGLQAVVTGAVHAGAIEVAGAFRPATITRVSRQVFQGRLDTDVLAGGNMALWRSALDQIGMFDERLGAGSRWSSAEDNDLGFRLMEAGYCIHYVPEARVYHRAWRPSGDYYRIRWTYGLGKGGFYTKHASRHDLHTLKRAYTDLRSRLTGVPRRAFRSRRAALGDVIYSAGVLWGGARWVLTRQRS
jgi:GT2 family glycosyltransferase